MQDYRGYIIQPINNLIGYEIRHTGKGSLAKVLSGSFTSKRVASIAIDSYLDNKEGKEEDNVEISSGSGGEQIQRRANYRRKPSNNS